MPLSQLCARIYCRRVGTLASGRGPSPRGQALVEFALALPLFLVLMLAVLDFGRMMAVNSAAVSASREAARYGAAVGTVDHDGNSGTPPIERYIDCAGIRAAARDATAALITLTDTQIEIRYDNGAGVLRSAACPPVGAADPVATDVQNLDRIVVQVTLTYEAATPPIQAFIGPVTVQSIDRRTIVKAVP